MLEVLKFLDGGFNKEDKSSINRVCGLIANRPDLPKALHLLQILESKRGDEWFRESEIELLVKTFDHDPIQADIHYKGNKA